MHLYIKNMVCDRCILAVRKELDRQNLPYRNIRLGEVELEAPPAAGQLKDLEEGLRAAGFELLSDSKAQTVEKIKNVVVSLVHRGEQEVHLKWSALLEERLQRDYHYLSALFSSVEGVTIEKYVILQKVERIKELLKYHELSLTQIADQMGYSSVQHLSQQFKKVTGLTPTRFQEDKESTRKPLDKV
ncbi:helix-turn-helix transcriptional regulator [Paraflavisolibacter sp. H34]|uniref:helix-turn-helix domain-containing protein n=1 Tax=Huijunlia imazamoxiresistens TaxID=3127457 RepID=UPI0030160D2D